MTVVEKELIEAAREVMTLKRAVIRWSREEGEAGRLVQNHQCPKWEEYMKAEQRLARAMVEL